MFLVFFSLSFYFASEVKFHEVHKVLPPKHCKHLYLHTSSISDFSSLDTPKKSITGTVRLSYNSQRIDVVSIKNLLDNYNRGEKSDEEAMHFFSDVSSDEESGINKDDDHDN